MYPDNALPQYVPVYYCNSIVYSLVPGTAPTNVNASNMATPTPAPAAAEQRLGPSVPKSTGCIAAVRAWQRRDPRLARLQQAAGTVPAAPSPPVAVVVPTSAPDAFDTRRARSREQRKRRSEKLLRVESESNHIDTKFEAERNPVNIKITRPEVKQDGEVVPAKRKRDNVHTELAPAAEKKCASPALMPRAKEHCTDGQLDNNQYNSLMYQILQLQKKLDREEDKQREILEIPKRNLKGTIEENHKVSSPKSSPNERNRFGDIDMRFGDEALDMKTKGLLPTPPMMPMFGPYQQQMPWRGPTPRAGEQFGPRRFQGPMPPYFRAGKFERRTVRPPIDPRKTMPPLPTPTIGMCQGECPLTPYKRSESPPPLGAPGFAIPPTDFKVIEYIEQDPFKTIEIDGIAREIRFYGNTAVIMLDWDDPREIKFLPGCRRVTLDNKDSVVLTFNEGYKQVVLDDQVFDIKFGAPTRELYINGMWYECFFGGQPLGVIIDGKPRLVHLEGPIPQVDIGKAKRTDLVAGKINLIVNATQMHPVYLDAKVQKILVNGQYLTVRFVDSLRTVLINEQPFKVEFEGLPKPIVVGSKKYFIRFSALPRNIKPGHVQIANMEGIGLPLVPPVRKVDEIKKEENQMKVDQQHLIARPVKTPSPELEPDGLGLDMLASVMPSSNLLAFGSKNSVAEPLFSKTDKISGLETPMEEKPAPVLPISGNINVNDLFAKLVATGIVQVPSTIQSEPQEKTKNKPEEVKNKPREDKNIIHKVDLMKSETFRVKQPGLVAKLYGGMQCSGCGARFPPEHTVRYSQHLDWHFRQNRRHRDAKRHAQSRPWHYVRSDWMRYEEVENLEEIEKSWFETGSSPAASGEDAVEVPTAAASASASHCCALCGDMFQIFYNDNKEEWHLRNAIKHNDVYYHPICFDELKKKENPMEVEPIAHPVKMPSFELKPESLGIDMLVNVMPSSNVLASGSKYSVAEPLFSETDKISGLQTPMEEKPAPVLPISGNINVHDLFAKLVATGIVQVPSTTQPEPQNEPKNKPEEVGNKPREDKNIIHSNPAALGEGSVEAPAPAPLATPSAAASAPASHCCALCGDMFQQFYNEDKEEWHLRNAIKHNDDYYHPFCFEDHKTSLTFVSDAEEPKVKKSSDDVATEEKTEEEVIEIKDVDETAEQSDNESVVIIEDPVEFLKKISTSTRKKMMRMTSLSKQSQWSRLWLKMTLDRTTSLLLKELHKTISQTLISAGLDLPNGILSLDQGPGDTTGPANNR